jgi:hypothetical protein
MREPAGCRSRSRLERLQMCEQTLACCDAEHAAMQRDGMPVARVKCGSGDIVDARASPLERLQQITLEQRTRAEMIFQRLGADRAGDASAIDDGDEMDHRAGAVEDRGVARESDPPLMFLTHIQCYTFVTRASSGSAQPTFI